jgi:transposase
MSLKELASHFEVSVATIARKIARLDLPSCPVSLRNKRSGAARKIWTGEAILAEIQRLSKEEQINSSYVQKNHSSFHGATAKEFGSWGKAVEAAGYKYEDVNLYAHRITWDRETILNRILQLHEEGEDLTASHVRDNHGDLFNAVRRESTLGDWESAVEAAGLDYGQICLGHWGSPYQANDGRQYPSHLEGRVGDRIYALREKGLIRSYSTQVRVKEGRGWRCDFVIHYERGRPDLWLEVDGLGDARQDSSYFKDNEKINHYVRAGFNFAVVRTPRQAEQAIKTRKQRQLLTSDKESPRHIKELGDNRYTDLEIVAAVKRLADQLGRAPTSKEMDKLGGVSYGTVASRLGWANAITMAGYIPTRGLTKEHCVEILWQARRKLGDSFSMRELATIADVHASTIVKFFGTWEKALEVVGCTPKYKKNRWNAAKIIDGIRLLDQRLRRLAFSHLETEDDKALYCAAQRYFGSWRTALEAAGIDPDQRITGWCRNHDYCVRCGRDEYRHAAKGLCASCYYREQKERKRRPN